LWLAVKDLTEEGSGEEFLPPFSIKWDVIGESSMWNPIVIGLAYSRQLFKITR